MLKMTKFKHRGVKALLTRPVINYFKDLRNAKPLSINQIKNRLNINWRTVKKYADENQLLKERPIKSA